MAAAGVAVRDVTMKEWPGKKASKRALLSPRAEKAWCRRETAEWMTERTNVDIPIPGMGIGDTPSGMRMAFAWEGLPFMVDQGLPVAVVLAERGGERSHVRLESGEVHDGHPDQCGEGVCIAEKVMGE